MIQEKTIRDKWVEIVHSQAKGGVVDSTSLAVEIARWAENKVLLDVAEIAGWSAIHPSMVLQELKIQFDNMKSAQQARPTDPLPAVDDDNNSNSAGG